MFSTILDSRTVSILNDHLNILYLDSDVLFFWYRIHCICPRVMFRCDFCVYVYLCSLFSSQWVGTICSFHMQGEKGEPGISEEKWAKGDRGDPVGILSQQHFKCCCAIESFSNTSSHRVSQVPRGPKGWKDRKWVNVKCQYMTLLSVCFCCHRACECVSYYWSVWTARISECQSSTTNELAALLHFSPPLSRTTQHNKTSSRQLVLFYFSLILLWNVDRSILCVATQTCFCRKVIFPICTVKAYSCSHWVDTRTSSYICCSE